MSCSARLSEASRAEPTKGVQEASAFRRGEQEKQHRQPCSKKSLAVVKCSRFVLCQHAWGLLQPYSPLPGTHVVMYT